MRNNAMTDPNQENVILVTGATGAIGFEIATQAAAAGNVVGVHGSRKERVASALAELRERVPGARLIPLTANFQHSGDIENLVTQLVEQTGRLDAVIHCAITGAPGISGLLAKTDPTQFGLHAARVMGILQELCFFALPHLSRQGGTIITFASDAGRFAAPRQSVVGGAFGGIVAFVRNLAMEVSRDGVRVHCITPSYVKDTPIFDAVTARSGHRTESAFQRAGLGLPTPADIAPMALFLCGAGAAKITGQVISINGGLNA